MTLLLKMEDRKADVRSAESAAPIEKLFVYLLNRTYIDLWVRSRHCSFCDPFQFALKVARLIALL